MTIEGPKASMLPALTTLPASAPLRGTKRARESGAVTLDVVHTDFTAPAAKRLRVSTVQVPTPEDAKLAPPEERLKQLSEAIGKVTVNHAQLNVHLLRALRGGLSCFAGLAIASEQSAGHYQMALLTLLEAGGRGDAFGASGALYEHMRKAEFSPPVLRQFLATAAHWLPSANSTLATQLCELINLLRNHPEPSVSARAGVLYDEFARQAALKRQADQDAPSFKSLENAIAGSFKLRIDALEGEYLDESRDNLAWSAGVVRRSGVADPALRDSIERLQHKVASGGDIEAAVYATEARVSPEQVQQFIDRAHQSEQTAQISVGADEAHAIAVSLRILDGRASVGIINAGNGAPENHQMAFTRKSRVVGATSGLWAGMQATGDGNCMVRAKRLSGQLHAGREVERRLHLLSRTVLIYVHDKSSNDKTLTRAAGAVESKRLFGVKGRERQFVDAQMRIDSIPLLDLRDRLVEFFNAGIDADTVQKDGLAKMYQFFGTRLTQAEAASYLPGKPGTLAVDTMASMGLLQQGGWDREYLRPTTDLLDPTFDAEAASKRVQQNLRDAGNKRPISAQKIKTFLQTLQRKAREDGAFYYSRLPPENVSG